MAKNQPLRIKDSIYEDECGVVYRAKDTSGQRVHLRKPKPTSPVGQSLKPEEAVAYQVAIERLASIHHPSLLQVVSGGTDSKDGLPYVTTRPQDGESLDAVLSQKPLSVDEATTLLSQLMEVCDLLSHLLAEDGVWVETSAVSILVSGKSPARQYVFWPAPLKAISKQDSAPNFQGIVEIAELALGKADGNLDERQAGHLLLWVKWLREAGRDASVREARDMLAAAAGVEPPPPVDQLVERSLRKSDLLENLPKMQELMKRTVPKMPLFALLSVMFVIQAFIGWVIVRKINESTDDRLNSMSSSYSATPYTVEGDPNRENERGSQPLDFD